MPRAEAGNTMSRRACRRGSRSGKSDQPFLLGPGVGQRSGETGHGEVGSGGAVDERRDDPRRDESERREQADVAFGLALARGDVRKGGHAVLDEIVDPGPRLYDRQEHGVTRFGFESLRGCWGVENTLDGTEALRCPGQHQGGRAWIAAVFVPAYGVLTARLCQLVI